MVSLFTVGGACFRINDYERPFTPEPGLAAKRRVCFPGRGGSGEWNRTATAAHRTQQSSAHTHISHVTTTATEENEESARGGRMGPSHNGGIVL